ncbi:unnamed protein product [Bursaphelenchus xylophilus]|uniref:(pine wood nematode) hypothetical protein n=1 Tax=Bursaphelenchus xylophilus TaxID=6326 RepID=A0A1I7S2N3_BURXY|nr:unnamed protein product [Bursaphelenchus xylophilus]CAG9121800.1 unnamed protein product [Bursaphelenchus xylophilus]
MATSENITLANLPVTSIASSSSTSVSSTIGLLSSTATPVPIVKPLEAITTRSATLKPTSAVRVTSLAPQNDTKPFLDIKDLVGPEIYQKLSQVYANKNLLVVDKLKELDDIFMTLNESTLAKLPTPKSFRNLDEEFQKRVRQIYYNKTIGFENKVQALQKVLESLPADKLKLVPLQADLPGLIDFDVPVLLQFNGQIETYLLRDYLNNDEFDALRRIVERKNISEVARAKLVGRLLRTAYERDAVNFPTPLSDDLPYVPEAIRKLGIHLMFSKNPFDNIESFTAVLKTLEKKNVVSKTKKRNAMLSNYNQFKDWLALSAFVRRYMA